MLTTYQLVVYAVAVVLLLPMTLYSLVVGSRAPQNRWLGRFFRAEKHLAVAGDLFLLTVCATAACKLAVHFGYLDAGASDFLVLPLALVFGATFAAYLTLWIRAILKVRRESRTPA
jgi:hypothetical protein